MKTENYILSRFSFRLPPLVWRVLGAALGLFLMTSARAQTVTFPDPNLEAALRDALQIYAPTNITQGNLSSASFTNFAANNRGIVNLTGLQYATNLTFLQMRGNYGQTGLTNASILTNFTKLYWLEIPFNQITNPAPVAALTNLTYLDIGWNRDAMGNSITDASFVTNLHKLSWLSLFYLGLHNVTPVSGLTALTNFTYSYNYGATNAGSFNGLTNMVEFYATASGLSNISFVTKMPHLTKLDFGGCNVSDLAPLLSRNLQALWAYSNPLTNANLVANFTSLTLLHLDGDGLTNISSFGRLTGLTELSLDNNPGIVSLFFLNGLTNLTYLSVGQEPLSNVTVLASLTNLTELHLHDDINLTSIAPLSNLSQLQILDLNNCPGVDFNAVTNLGNLRYLDLNNDNLQALPFVPGLSNLYQLSLDNNRFTTLDALAGLRLGELHFDGNHLGDISALLPMDSLNYLNIQNNYLDISPGSVAWQVITNLQNRFAGDPNYNAVDYGGQMLSSTLAIFDQPLEACVPVGGNAYFAISASSTDSDLQMQWQRNGVDLPGATNNFLWLTGVNTNQAGSYRVLLQDDNGGRLSEAAPLYAGDVNCGRTILIQQQPANTVAAPGEDVFLTINATTTLTNLYYQWLYNGTNIDGQTDSELDLFGAGPSVAGFYQVQLTDDSTNVVYSDIAELRVVDVVSMVDPSLSNQVAQALGLTAGAPIHLDDLDNLNYLYIGHQGITNVTGLEDARNLYALDLSGNQIADPTPLHWLTALSSLNLDTCGLQDASFISDLVNLYDLNLANNQIHSVPDMSQLANLHYLNLNYDGCLINFPRLAGLTNLLALSIHDVCAPDLSYTMPMTQLQTLDAGGDGSWDNNKNTISNISPIAGKTNMNWLSLSWDQVTNVPLVGPFTNLTHLYLSGNTFDNIGFVSNMPGLLELWVNSSQVTNLSPLAGDSLLTSLDVSYIATSNLTALSGLTNLLGLTAGGNHAGTAVMFSNLTKLQSLTFDLSDVPDASPLVNLTNLSWLQLENNKIPNVSALANKINLRNLYLSGNQIHDLTPLAGLTNVNSLSLSVNGFTNVAPLATLTNLNWLVMQSNHIQNVAPLVSLAGDLNTLDVSLNEITNMSPITNLHALNWLGLWNNRLTSIPSLAGLPGITSLDLRANQITNISGISGMIQLNWLSLIGNRLTAIQSFTNLPNLATLDLTSNLLTDVSGIANMPQLNWLGLKGNYLTSVQPLIGLPNLTSLDLTSNLLTDVSSVTNLTSLHWLYLAGNNLQTIHALTNLAVLYYIDLTGNLLDTNTSSSAWADITGLQAHNTYVNYDPQRTSGFLPSPVLLFNMNVAANQFTFAFLSQTNRFHTIESSTDLTNWIIVNTLPGDGTIKNFSVPGPTQRGVFYRVRTH